MNDQMALVVGLLAVGCGQSGGSVPPVPRSEGQRPHAVAPFLIENGDFGYVRDPDVRLPPPYQEEDDDPFGTDRPTILDPVPPPPVCTIVNDVAVPSAPEGVVFSAAVATREAGFGFAVVWAVAEGIETNLRARLLDECGVVDGADFEVDGSGLVVAGPVAAPLADGGFVLAWSREDFEDDDGAGVVFQRFDVTGAAAGPLTLANDAVADDQLVTSAAAVGAGFALAWEDHAPGALVRPDPVLRTFDQDGRPLSDEVVMAPAPDRFEDFPVLGSAADATVIAVWAEGGLEPFGRRLSALGVWSDGSPLDLAGAEEAFATSAAGSATSYAVGVTSFETDLAGDVELVLVPAAGSSTLTTVSVASAANAGEGDSVVVPRIGGGWTIAWTDESAVDVDDQHGGAVRARRYNAAGMATDGTAFVIPTTTLYDQELVAGASAAGGELFVWLDTSRVGDRDGGLRARLVPTAFDPALHR